MIWILLATYVWAGMTTAYNIWQLEQINKLFDKLSIPVGFARIPSKGGGAVIWYVLIAVWPVAFFVTIISWARFQAADSSRKTDGGDKN